MQDQIQMSSSGIIFLVLGRMMKKMSMIKRNREECVQNPYSYDRFVFVQISKCIYLNIKNYLSKKDERDQKKPRGVCAAPIFLWRYHISKAKHLFPTPPTTKSSSSCPYEKYNWHNQRNTSFTIREIQKTISESYHIRKAKTPFPHTTTNNIIKLWCLNTICLCLVCCTFHVLFFCRTH